MKLSKPFVLKAVQSVNKDFHKRIELMKQTKQNVKPEDSAVPENEADGPEIVPEIPGNNDTEELENSKKRKLEDPPVTKATNLDLLETNSTERRMSWAFWNSSAESKQQSTDSSDKVKSNVKEEVAKEPLKDRSHSWSFWVSKHEQAVYPFQPNVIVRSTATKFDAAKSEPSGPVSGPIPGSVMGPVSGPASGPVSGSVLESGSQSVREMSKKRENKRPNLIVPSFRETLPPSTAFTTLVSGIKRAKVMLGYTGERQKHLYRRNTAKIFKRVLIIGVHGFFPTRVLRRFIGEPTGTSMKLAQVAEGAVLSWASDNNMEVEIQKIALEKEGKIFDRVDFFYEVLKQSAEDIKQADFIFVCAHSQGTPVSIMLMSKLLEYGIIDEDKRIGILGMAGINNGPFYGMEQSLLVRAYSTFENESMLELFQFQNFESLQSRKYLESVRNLVCHNTKITYVGSIDDQLVPLYSSIASHVKHPNIYKAVYIDGGSDTPDFVARILKISCMLQNLGYSDHDVIKEISYALAGPLTGGGHSNIYNDINVYKLALNFTMKTEDAEIAIEEPVLFKSFDLKKLGSNPFNLPWCVRGLFFEAMRKLYRGNHEIEMVFKEFDEWNPESKALKDLKYRLNGIKAKL
ncbi:hypothetical protein FOA43_002226 [Brettanomyces nanus]|uniref:YMC020W-like alpha/beta hydrolase domain-containing protein n=1 Tax=Eeniella nana TaxID=13502 RepID=A0A875S545_EENNA|nr:uncharacterized protein FOA43_002226 [Brettanomyces nanus]QPG74889.1 hypothetical protein FOA43_002226 [Brettanomyces nanus]